MDKIAEQIIIWIKENWYTPYCGYAVVMLTLFVGVMVFGPNMPLLHLGHWGQI